MVIDSQNNVTCSNLLFIRLTRRTKITQIIVDMPNFFFLNVSPFFLKHLRILILIFLKTRIQVDYCWTSMIRVCLRNFFLIKICNFIAMRFYFGFQKFFIVHRQAVKFFFVSMLTLFQIVLCFFNKSSSSIKKYIHLVCPS